MNKKEFTAFIADKENVTKAEADKMIEIVLDGIRDALMIGENVKIIGFGTFEAKARAGHTGRNPHDPTQVIEIPAHKVVKFKAGKELKAAINE